MCRHGRDQCRRLILVAYHGQNRKSEAAVLKSGALPVAEACAAPALGVMFPAQVPALPATPLNRLTFWTFSVSRPAELVLRLNFPSYATVSSCEMTFYSARFSRLAMSRRWERANKTAGDAFGLSASLCADTAPFTETRLDANVVCVL